MFECVNYISINKNTCLGIATIHIPKWKMTMPGFRLHQKDGKRWIQFPFRKATDKEGKEIFPPNIWFDDRETKDKFCELVMIAIEEHATRLSNEEDQPEDKTLNIALPELEVPKFLEKMQKNETYWSPDDENAFWTPNDQVRFVNIAKEQPATEQPVAPVVEEETPTEPIVE